MKLIVGLGNPGEKYVNTRHNVGFMFVDALAKHPEIARIGQQPVFELNKKTNSQNFITEVNGEKVILAKPETYMNLSGESVRQLISYYQCNECDLIVASDDIDLPLGITRIRHEGSSGGQKGLQSIIDVIGKEFTRIRFGVGPAEGRIGEMEYVRPRADAAQYVLSEFSEQERKMVAAIIAETVNYVIPYVGSKDDVIPAHTLTVL